MSPKLTDGQQKELLKTIRRHGSTFSTSNTIGHVREFKVPIETKNHPLPPQEPNRPVSPHKWRVFDQYIDQFIAWDVIEESNSLMASAIVLVWQNGKWRFCIDFRNLNAITKRDG